MKKPENKLQELVTRLQQACGDNLVSVVLYGSAAREDFHEEFSDVNVLVVLQQLAAEFVCADLARCCSGGVTKRNCGRP